MAQVEYSCKRKKDFVTSLAIIMFVAILLFEIYLIVFIRIQLQRENAMAHDVIKQEMLMKTEYIRGQIKGAKPKTALQECEVQMVTNCLDSLVQFIRRNKDTMTSQQIVEVNELLSQLETYTLTWNKNKYLFKQDSFDTKPILDKMEAKLDQAAADGH